MSYKTVLLHVDSDEHDAQRQAFALALARAFEARIVGLFVAPPPVLPPAYGEAAAYVGPDFLEAQREASAAEGERLRQELDKACKAAGVDLEFRSAEGAAEFLVSEHARYADIAVVSQSEQAGVAKQLPERVILTSGGPVFTVPYAGRFEALPRRIMVAWNGSREAARAVRDALPLLARAEQVIVLEVDPEDEHGQAAIDLAGHLARHRIKAAAEHTVSAELSVGDVLLSALSDRGCDGLVMGAYGHSRVRELALGGATRSVLGHMTVPVLFAY